MDTIGFIGLGHMGGNMAARLLAGGYTVHGSDLSPDQAKWLVDQGLRWHPTPSEVAQSADTVFTSLPNDDVVRSVATGPEGLLDGTGPGKIWVDVSTISPSVSRQLAERTSERGARMLDAPVSGSVPQVQTGTLTIMVGGDPQAYSRVEPALRVLGTPTHIGDNGQGLVLKLAINISLAVQMLAFAEGFLLVENDGIDPRLGGTVMTSSAIGSPTLKARLPLVLGDADEAWFDMGLMRKDIGLALAAAREMGLTLPTAGVAEQVLNRAIELGYEHRDIAAMPDVLEHLAEVNRERH